MTDRYTKQQQLVSVQDRHNIFPWYIFGSPGVITITVPNPLSSFKADVKKVKEVDLYSAFIVVHHTQGAQVRITQCYLQITPCMPLPRKHSPDGASPD